MREIKFRAWDKELKQMVYDVQATYDGLEYSKNNKDIDVDVYDWMDCFESWFNDRRFDLMQYTGIKDKKGVEIYVGDIVKHFNKKYEVVKHFNGKYVGKRNDFAELDIVIAYTSPECEVIGNIYENPDILEGLK